MAETRPSTLPRLPRWLPRIVRDHVLNQVSMAGLANVSPLVLRLVSAPAMEKVWSVISSVENQEKLVVLVEYVQSHPTLQGNPDARLEPASNQKQRAVFTKVSDYSQAIIEQLGRLSKANNADEAWHQLEAALKRSELFELGNPAKDRLLQLREMQARLKYIQRHISIPLLVETIGVAAKLAAEAPDHPDSVGRPNKLAKPHKLILDLTQFFVQTLYIQPTDSMMAAIVNTAFAFSGQDISPQDVRKLLDSKEP